ncbi:hypothetical protein KPH14_004819 [Odynerus spinipes]|uniref:TEP1-F n=1 Tax=Odynerus spinipes TaxID=1348599 RepID=A0AAD9RML0_9HYME|nr:hypothetical protein KPH14_004819 [Odynerus spinipes]
MDWLCVYTFLLVGIVTNAVAEPYYAVIAPKVVRPDSEYHVTVSTVGVSTPSNIYVELSANLDNGDRFNVSQIVTVEPYSTRIVRLKVGDTSPGHYKLFTRGLSGIQFSNSTDLQYVHKSYSVFIQTDRAIYKPGNKVLIRCLILDSRLRPSLTRQVDVYITDGGGNRIKQWNQQPITRGIVSAELELSKSPVLGTWKITVNVGDQTFEKEFEVAEYVLPKFEVIIDAPKHATFKESKITATVRAKYTYGKPVKGEATITAYPNIFSGVIQPIFQQPVRKVVPIDGKVTIDFDILSELRLTDENERPIRIEATVEEELTGRRQNVSMDMTLHKHKYTMELIKTSEYYKPGLKYTAFIKLTYHDGAPVQDTKNPVLIAYGFTYNQSAFTNITRFLDEHGMIQLDIYPPNLKNNVFVPLNIEAQYLNLYEWFSSANHAMSRSDEYIQAILKTENPMVNHEVEIEVNSTTPLKYLSYEVLGRGDILDAGSIYVQDKHTTTLKFLATYVMAPTAHIIVYYIRDDGEVIADALDVELEGVLQNFVDIKVAPEEVEPGKDVSLTITSKPNSYIGILGVDQRSLLLKSGNDISYKQVEQELRSYDSVEESPYSDIFRSFWRPGSGTADDVFKNTGAVIMTNGYLFEYYAPIYYRASVDSLDIHAPLLAESSREAVFSTTKVTVRKNFPETWLWQALDAGFKGETEFRRTVPDSITSWVLTAFSVNDVYGLGLIKEPRKLKVFRPFFISMDLPYSVIRGEIVAIQIVVFNYMNKNVVADVLLENVGQFEFAEISNEVHDTPKLELYRKKKLEIKANSGASVSFMIIPKELGYITIKATAQSILAGDSVEHKLLVKAEGETQYVNKAVFLDLRSTRSVQTNVTIEMPKNIVPDSEHIVISAVGDILGPSIPNLANLIKMPFGCGEQNMLNFVPNIVILNYLKNTNQLKQAIQAKALKYLEIGYQQELTYKHKDGSFSAFGMSDANGSTWLTAFVAKSFKQAMEYITIDSVVIDDALQWLSNNQAENGSFPEVGRVSHKDMQGGAAKGLALTAFTLLAFLENPDAIEKYRNNINRGVDYIVRNMEGLDDPYALSICTYVLNLAKHPYETNAFSALQSKALTEDDLKWWSKPIAKDDKNPWHSLPQSVDVEMTSYALLTYLQQNLVADAIPIMKWLVKQRNSEGGFASTQDTVIGIYALAKLGEKLMVKENSISMTFTYEGGQNQMSINPRNTMILQKQILPKKIRSVNVTATGNGFAVVQVSYQYNLNVTGAWPLFTLDPQVDRNSNANHLQLSICSGFVPTKEANESNMAVMEISLPSGFTVDRDSLPSLEVSQNVKRVETKNGDTMVVLYFDKMVVHEYCPTVSAYRVHKVADQKPVPVSIYDYYDSSRRARVFYEPRVATLCDICEDEELKLLEETLDFGRSVIHGQDTFLSMRRKSERNKAKATPEKKVEKPTRKSTRRRGKRSPSTSPEQDNVEAATVSATCTKETEKSQVQTRLQNKELEQVSDSHEEKVSSTEGEIKVQSPEDEEDNNGDSVWKVARADASPGEIQKLKLCRQRNTSEASSDASLSRKKSNKWQESGEGVAEEVDSADEQLVSCTRMSSGNEQPYDPSSSYPGQDSNEEVSDSKEILPETTSANLSDDKPNIDQQGDSNEASCSNQNLHSEPSKPSSTTAPASNSNGDHMTEERAPDISKENQPEETITEKPTEVFEKETSVENVCKEASTDDDEEEDKRKTRKSDSSSESNDEKRTKIDCSSNRTASRAGRRKHRNKYRDSSNSETPDSEDEQPVERKIEESFTHKEKSNAIDICKEKERSRSPEPRSNPLLNNISTDVEHSENAKPKTENENEKQDHVPSTDVQTTTQKPAKVNLKRSFSSRMLTDKNDTKKDDTDPNANGESNNQSKENHNNEENEFKSVPRKRRWGTTLSTDSAPSFSISTDSLKALVPGAKPLSINEVRLSKDDDDERDQKDSDKWLGDDINDQKSKDVLAQKNGAAKKGDGKVDNHIVAARRKISIVKEPPHVKSPSPPATKPTNILLIKNLVRPFTLNQIKELLSRTGTIVENGFWMDRIKSKCFVEYANEDQAFETRQALHGISWPVSNPKRLHVEYATKDDMEMARELSKDQPVTRKTEPLLTTDSWQQDWGREERTNSAKVVVVREWDLGKEDGQQHVKEKERDKKEQDKKRRQRSRSPALEAHLPAPARKFKKKEDDPPPAKLLDDLFRKTKATPCIYWLPLTNEQIVVKEEMRRQHMAEHARRLEEMRRAERSRDSRRRRSPRK